MELIKTLLVLSLLLEGGVEAGASNPKFRRTRTTKPQKINKKLKKLKNDKTADHKVIKSIKREATSPQMSERAKKRPPNNHQKIKKKTKKKSQICQFSVGKSKSGSKVFQSSDVIRNGIVLDNWKKGARSRVEISKEQNKDYFFINTPFAFKRNMLKIRIKDRHLMSYKYYLRRLGNAGYRLEIKYLCGRVGGGTTDVSNPFSPFYQNHKKIKFSNFFQFFLFFSFVWDFCFDIDIDRLA